MYKPQEGVGEFGELVPGPPWILGHRGAPRDAPENTLISLRRAIDLGLDGVEYDLFACASGEPVLIHDETLERTTDGKGAVRDLTLPELAGLDAGGWFRRAFVGEPLPLLEEALELTGNRAGTWPQHMIELKDPALVGEVARQLSELRRPLSVRIASFHRAVCLEARDLGLPSMLLNYEAHESDRRFVRDERIQAYGTAPSGWETPAGADEWNCERWSWSVDEPADLLSACRQPLFGFNTNDPRRALATRALVHLSPGDEGPYPLVVPELEVALPRPRNPSNARVNRGEDAAPAAGGEWSGRWKFDLVVRNPFPFRVAVALAMAIRGGAFEFEGLPVQLALQPGETVSIGVGLRGGSWSPAEDPVIHARFQWTLGPGRPEESLRLECPLVRVRTLVPRREALRVPMLREQPGQPGASMSVKLRGGELLARVEDPGGLEDARAILRVGARVVRGGHGVRVPLPDRLPGGDASAARQGLPFSVGFEGRLPGTRDMLQRRWAGGLPYGLRSGAPGRLVLGARA